MLTYHRKQEEREKFWSRIQEEITRYSYHMIGKALPEVDVLVASLVRTAKDWIDCNKESNASLTRAKLAEDYLYEAGEQKTKKDFNLVCDLLKIDKDVILITFERIKQMA